MFELLSPISLLALSAVALPLILHLRKDRKTRVLPVGSIALFSKETRFRGKRRRISEWLLLALRMLLVAVLALLLAGPVWKTTRSQTGGWVVTDRGAYGQRKALVDSLLHAGYELHAFERGFPVIEPKFPGIEQNSPAIEQNSPAIEAADTPPVSYWSLAALLQRQSPPGVPLYVLTENALTHFKGPRPVIEPRLQWHLYTAAAKSRVDSGLSITIYGDDRRYVEAAVKAIAQYTGRRLTLTDIPSGGIVPDNQDWLFWLSIQPLPTGKKAAHLFRYEAGKERPDNTPIDFGETGNPIRLHRIVATVNTPDVSTDNVQDVSTDNAPDVSTDHAQDVSTDNAPHARWRDAWGNALLTSDDTTFHFYSRLDPAWTDLVWSPSFPAILMRLLYGHPDANVIDPAQLSPDGTGHETVHAETTDLSHAFWLIAFLLFILERVMARKEGYAV